MSCAGKNLKQKLHLTLWGLRELCDECAQQREMLSRVDVELTAAVERESVLVEAEQVIEGHYQVGCRNVTHLAN